MRTKTERYKNPVDLSSKVWGWRWLGLQKLTLKKTGYGNTWCHVNHYYGIRFLGFRILVSRITCKVTFN